MDNEPMSGQAYQGDVTTERSGRFVLSGRRRWALVGAMIVLSLTASWVGCAVVGRGSSADGAKFAQGTIAVIATDWNADALIALASPELLQSTPPDKLRAFIAFVGGRLGSLKSCQDVQNGPWQLFLGSAGLSAVTWHYSDCQFEKGPGRITLQLVRRSGAWRVVTINVNSDLLISSALLGVSQPAN